MKRSIYPVNLGIIALATLGVCLGLEAIAQAEEITPSTSQIFLLAQGGGGTRYPQSSGQDNGVRAQINQLYRLVLNRAPDDYGMSYYLGRYYNDRWTMEQIRQDMYNSDEGRRARERVVSESNNNGRYSDRYDSQSNGRYDNQYSNRYDNRDRIGSQINQFYRRYLRRDADNFGIDYYLGRYYNDGWSLDRIQEDIRNSDEARRLRDW